MAGSATGGRAAPPGGPGGKGGQMDPRAMQQMLQQGQGRVVQQSHPGLMAAPQIQRQAGAVPNQQMLRQLGQLKAQQLKAGTPGDKAAARRAPPGAPGGKGGR